MINPWLGMLIGLVPVALVIGIFRRKRFVALSYGRIIFSLVVLLGGLLPMAYLGGELLAVTVFDWIGWQIHTQSGVLTEAFKRTIWTCDLLLAWCFTWTWIDAQIRSKK